MFLYASSLLFNLVRNFRRSIESNGCLFLPQDHAIARCQDCSKFLCSNCRKAHSSMLCFENHKVVSFEAFDQGHAQIHRSVSCLRHPREVALLYDPTCWRVRIHLFVAQLNILCPCTQICSLVVNTAILDNGEVLQERCEKHSNICKNWIGRFAVGLKLLQEIHLCLSLDSMAC